MSNAQTKNKQYVSAANSATVADTPLVLSASDGGKVYLLTKVASSTVGTERKLSISLPTVAAAIGQQFEFIQVSANAGDSKVEIKSAAADIAYVLNNNATITIGTCQTITFPLASTLASKVSLFSDGVRWHANILGTVNNAVTVA